MHHKNELYEHIPFDEIHFANVNNAQSKNLLIKKLYKNRIRKKRIRHLLLCIFTFGIQRYKEWSFATLIIKNELAKRKIKYVKRLHHEIESIRSTLGDQDPRDDINQIFMKIQSIKSEEGDRGVEFKKIYTPNELLLFITTPENDPKIIRKPKALVNNDEYLKIWREIRRNTKNKQFHQIDKINTCYSILKSEYSLSPDQISDRVHRTKIGKSTPYNHTKLRDLLRSFQEIVIAFQDFDDLTEHEPSLHKTLDFLLQLSSEEVQLLERFVTEEQIPKDLPASIRKTMIKIANQTDVIDKIQEKNLAHTVELILNSEQWNLFLKIQNPSASTLKLLDWAYHETCTHTPHDVSFIDTFNKCSTTRGEGGKYQEVFDAAESKELLNEMCTFFADEIHREWPSILMYRDGKEIFFSDKLENLGADKLLDTFRVLKELSQEDSSVLIYLQGALSQQGKDLLQQSLKGKLTEILGEPSEYFIPVFNIAHIAIARTHQALYEITYYFKHKVFKKGEQNLLSESSEDIPIILVLSKNEEHWTAQLTEKKLS